MIFGYTPTPRGDFIKLRGFQIVLERAGDQNMVWFWIGLIPCIQGTLIIKYFPMPQGYAKRGPIKFVSHFLSPPPSGMEGERVNYSIPLFIY